MIYPKAIFRTVIALSTVAAAAQATAVSPRSSSAGAKRGKGGRYVDTTTNAYGATGTDVVLPAGYPAGYAPNGVNVQAGASLRKITSPNNVGVQFSAASPSNVAKGTSGYVNLAANTYGSPRSLDNKKDVKGGVETGKKTNANYGTPAAPASPAKGGNYGAKIPIAPSSGGVKIGGNVSPSSGGVKDAKGGYGAKTNEDTNYGRDPPNGNTSGNYGKRDNGGKGVEFPVSPSSGGYTNGKGGKNNYVAAPPAPIAGATGGSRQGSRGGYKLTRFLRRTARRREVREARAAPLLADRRARTRHRIAPQAMDLRAARAALILATPTLYLRQTARRREVREARTAPLLVARKARTRHQTAPPAMGRRAARAALILESPTPFLRHTARPRRVVRGARAAPLLAARRARIRHRQAMGRRAARAALQLVRPS